MATALERAAESTQVVDVSDKRMSALEHRYEALKATEERLLPIERGSAHTLVAEIESTVDEMEQLAFAVEYGLPKLSDAPLRWRNRKGWPVLAPFSIRSASLNIRHARWNSKLEIHPAPAEPVVRHFYPDVLAKLRQKCGKNPGDEISLTAMFSGVIPDETRDKIREWPDHEVFLVTEVRDWNVKEVKRPILDPLVCVWRYKALWLIDKFDTTPIEEYIAKEFTT